jgi:hypothetical protein
MVILNSRNICKKLSLSSMPPSIWSRSDIDAIKEIKNSEGADIKI